MTITLYEIFRTPVQVKIIEELLKRQNEYFTISRMAKIIDASPSAVASRVDSLIKIGIVKVISGSEKAKIFTINKENPIVKNLINFYLKLSMEDP